MKKLIGGKFWQRDSMFGDLIVGMNDLEEFDYILWGLFDLMPQKNHLGPFLSLCTS